MSRADRPDGDIALEDLLHDLPRDARATDEQVVAYRRSPSDVLRLITFALASLCCAGGLAWARDAVLDLEDDILGLLDFLDPLAARILDGVAAVLVVAVGIGLPVTLVVLRRFRLLGYVLGGNVLAAALMALALWSVDRDPTPAVVNRIAEQAGVDVDRAISAVALAQFVAQLVVLAPFVSARWRRAGLVVVVALCTLRLLLATHLPGELLLSLAIGATSGCAVLLAFGRPDQRPTLAATAVALRAGGLDLVDLRAASMGARGTTHLVGELADGSPLFAEVQSPEERSADLLFRAYRFVRLRSIVDERPFSSLRRKVEHEALVALQAHDVGIRTPRLRAIAAVGAESMVLAFDRVDGAPLDQEEAIADGVLRAVWEQVALLRRRRLAHRDLRPANLLRDEAGEPWVIGFGFSEVAASDDLLDADVAQLLVATATTVGVDRAVAAAVDVLGQDAVGAAARLLQPLALSGPTRAELKHHHGLLDELRQEVVERTGIDEPTYVRLERFSPRSFLVLAMLAGATYFLLPQLADLPGIVDQVEEADWWWLPPLVVASLVTYVGATASILGAVPDRLPTVPTLITQVASSFTSRLAPSSVGGMALNLRFMQRAGVDPAVGSSGIGLNAVAGIAVHLALLLVFVVWAGRSAFDAIHLPDPEVLLYGVAAVAAIAVVGVAVPKVRHTIVARALPILRRSLHGLAQVLRSPAKLAFLVGGSALVTISYIVATYVAIEAFGGGLGFAEVGAIYLIGAAVASAAPTPGGLGAFEAAVIAGLVAAGLPNTVAVPAVFLLRLVTYWLPILPGWLCFTYLKRRSYV